MGGAIFDSLVGRDSQKAVLRSSLRNGSVNICLVGPPASGKSVAMECIDDSMGPNARKIDASSVTASKLRDIVAEDYEVLLLDEIDDMDTEAAEALSMPLQEGVVQKTTARDEYSESIRTQFIAAANHRNLPQHIESRFNYVEFPEYSDSEFFEVCQNVLYDRVEWIDSPETAEMAAETILDEMDTTDCREVIDVAQLAGGTEQVSEIARSMTDPNATVESDPLSISEIKFRNVTESDLDRMIDVMMNTERQMI